VEDRIRNVLKTAREGRPTAKSKKVALSGIPMVMLGAATYATTTGAKIESQHNA
jgi:hypothetical protein